ncbi:MAG TPA: phosphatase PAP2 family protein [Longimicrobiaceae bacterium]|nr:phosphatase PAP2 family protein [Longimicrobiaceae bacterium]
MSTPAETAGSAVHGHRRAGWALVEGIRSTWRRFREDAAALGRPAWVRWELVIAIGMVVTALVAFVAVRIGQHLVGRGMQEWDRELLLRIERENYLSFHDAIWFEALGSSSFLLPVVIFAAVVAIWAHRPLVAVTALAAYALHDPIVMMAWRLWDRARPDLIAGGIAAPNLHSYPSGHAVNVVATFGFFLYLWARRSGSWLERLLALLVLVALTGIVGLARVRMGTHWPSDIIAGVVIGLVWLVVTILALRSAEAKIHG